MQIAVLPLNAGPTTRAQLARQLSNFACEMARNATGKEVHAVNYMAQFPDESGVTRFAMVNPNEALNEPEMVQQFFNQADMQNLVDGLLDENEAGGGKMTIRVFQRGQETPLKENEYSFASGGIFSAARGFVETLIENLGGQLPEPLKDDENLFGTSNSEAFEQFMIGFDASQYIEKAQGMVAHEFDPSAALDSLAKALELDPDWEAPYLATLNLCRLCTQYRIGDANRIEATLKSLVEREPDDARGLYALGDFYGTVGNAQGAADNMEKAIVKLQMRAAQLRQEAVTQKNNTEIAEALEAQAEAMERDEAPILARLGMAQMGMGMPANAERNFRRAVELEGDEKPSLNLLAQVLNQTGRAHEVPALWKEAVEKSPNNPQNHVNYAMSLYQAGKEEEGSKVFENAITTLEDNVFPKRFYAPILAQKGDLDRAMDYYEDVIEVAPNEVPVLLEYAQALESANRAFEVPKVLRDVLNTDPDPNTRAQTQAWMVRLEQPKRVEAVQNAAKKLQEGDAEGAIRELKPLKTWMADYFELWMHLADAYNRTGEYQEAEQAAQQLLGMFPGCEPGYALLAAALHGQERDEDVYNFLRMAINNLPNSLTIAINLAQAAKWTGRDDEARSLISQIREATGNDATVAQILDQIEASPELA